MSYGLRGCDGRVYGLGVFDPPTRPNWIDPGYPPDSAIVAQNTRNNDAYQVAMAGAQAENNLDQCLANAENATPGAQRDAVLASCGQAYANAGAYAASTADTPVAWYGGGGSAGPFIAVKLPAASPRGGQLTFTSSRGGASLYTGDTWLVSITGASPNSPVTVSGSMPGGSFQGTPMGSTDGNGNFSKSGTVGPGEIGSWSEQWAVGGVSSGSFSFTVVAPPVPQVIFTKGGAATNGAPAGGPSPAQTAGSAMVAGFDLSKIPVWGWAVAAGVALFAMSKGGR